MAEPMYFQWQNEVLLRTIYPLREMKLRDFLVYYKEIDLWAEYRDMRIEDLQDEVQKYIDAQVNARITSYKSYKKEYQYFTNEDVRVQYMPKYRLTDETELAKVKELHRTFKTYLPKYADPRKEKYFIIQYLSMWEQHRKNLQQDIASRQRWLSIANPANPRYATRSQELEKLRNVTLPIVEEELERLYSFVSSFNKIEKARLQFYKERQEAERGSKGGRTMLDNLRTQLTKLEEQYQKLSTALDRLKKPPKPDDFMPYFTLEDITEQILTRYPQAEKGVVDEIKSLHQKLAFALRTLKDDAVKLHEINNHLRRLDSQLSKFRKEMTILETRLRSMPENWSQREAKQTRFETLRDVAMAVIQAEINQLTELQAGLVHSTKPQAEIAKMIQETERELLKLQPKLEKQRQDLGGVEKQLREKESILEKSEEEYLCEFVPDKPIGVKDLVRGKVEEYKASLLQKDHQQLLEEIVERFIRQPDRYPLWLQYMVIHFSGMRYATAHGSWADPKDLLVSLRTAELEKDFKKMDDDAVEALAQERISVYEAPNGDHMYVPALARAADPKSRDKIDYHLKGLKSLSPHSRRRALFNLRLDEEIYEIDALSPEKALDALELQKDLLPDWMWKQISALTPLRIKEAKSPDWEKLTPEEQEQSYEQQYAEYRRIMNEWKEKHLTGWREEHDRSNRLIVTRSVCNEVAEQIQHLRGHSPPGGLTAKAPWYMKQEREGKVPGTPRPYFKKPASEKDYTVGASILWLRFVNEEPNAWRIAQPLQTRDGHGLIPAEFMRKKPGTKGGWTYSQTNCVTRTRTGTRQKQWLRWIHEATVAEVAETADGIVVLTFETALPYDDPRMSAIGVFKHDLHNLLFDGGEETYNGSFVGYLPEHNIPVGDLEVMLDWNHILRRPVMSPAQLVEYRRKYIRSA